MSCASALLALCTGACTGTAPANRAPAPPPDVVLISVDTLRADRVGGALTPAMNAVAAEGARFLSARTTVPLTLPAHVSLMTGAFPPAHGVRLNGVHRFDGSRPTLARVFRDAGRDTAAFVGAFVLDRQFGLGDGFTTYDDQIPRSPDAPLRLEAERPASAVIDRAIAWLAGRNAGPASSRRPLFLFVHLYDPHAPYSPPADALARAGGQPYDGEVTFADAEIGRLLRTINSTGPAARTIVIILGDHGESLGEHGERTHGMLLYDGALRIPLIVAGAGVPAGEHREPVSLADVAPTVLRLAGLGVPGAMQGRDLFTAPAGQHEVYAETQYPQVVGWSPLSALVEERWKVIAPEGGGEELYDLEGDPLERQNVAAARREVVRAAAARLAGHAATGKPASSATPGAEARERLRALGYVASAPPAPGRAEAPNPAGVIGSWVDFEDALGQLTTGRSAEAVSRLAALSVKHPRAQVFRTSYALALSQSGRHREALAVYRDAVRTWPTDSMLFHDLSVAAARAGQPAEAIRAEQAALELDPRNAAAHNGLGLLLVDAERLGPAREAFERAVQLDGTSADYLANLANALRATGDRGRAESAYRQALRLDPRSANALNGLGVLLVENKRPLDAVSLLVQAVSVSPDFWEARLNLGIAYQMAGKTEEAAAIYRAVAAAPARFGRERQAAAELLRALGARR